MTRIRPGRARDLETLEAAQQTLTAPSPSLLEGGLTEPGPLAVLVAIPDGTDPSPAGENQGGRSSQGSAGDPVGYALLVPGPNAIYVPELAVSPGHQGNSHGSALLRAVVNRSRGTGPVRLAVAVTNEDALGFYQHHGFERESHLPDRFEHADGLLLTYRHGE